jgi:hypothetical protein
MFGQNDFQLLRNAWRPLGCSNFALTKLQVLSDKWVVRPDRYVTVLVGVRVAGEVFCGAWGGDTRCVIRMSVVETLSFLIGMSVVKTLSCLIRMSVAGKSAV